MYADRKNVLVNTVRQRKLDDRAFASIFKKCQDLSFVLLRFDIVDMLYWSDYRHGQRLTCKRKYAESARKKEEKNEGRLTTN